MMTFDFAVLGDSQPEGLLVAAGLVRKGFSVVIVPSSSLGELPPDAHDPLVLPSQLGQRKLNDLLFRAGFFRLEESGLMATGFESQILLKKNRLLFSGTTAQWLAEIEREFPQTLKTFSNLFREEAQPSQKLGKAPLRRAAVELLELQKSDPHLRDWISSECQDLLRPQEEERSIELIKKWLSAVLRQDNKSYRVDPKIKAPYHQFLLEHARKWGAVVCGEPCELKSVWTLFQISKTMKAYQLILNGMGGGRVLAKSAVPSLSEKMRLWMYLDLIDIPLSSVPEPLQEFSHINFGDSVGDLPSHRLLHLSIDRLRGEAHLSLGSWLSFDDTKSWATQIEKGRAALRKIVPFIGDEAFRALPSLLELTESRGECIRRGQSDRLIPLMPSLSRLERLWEQLIEKIPKRPRPLSVARRVYAVNPHYLPYRNRLSSFEESLTLLDYFEKKKKRQLQAS